MAPHQVLLFPLPEVSFLVLDMDAAAKGVQMQCCLPSYLMSGLLADYLVLPHTVFD